MDFTNKKFLAYLEIATDFAKQYPYLDTAIFTLFQIIEDGTTVKKKNIYKIKHFFFFLYAFYRYYSLRNIFSKNNIPSYKGIKILVIINSPGSQHYGDSIRLVENLVGRNQKILIVYGAISRDQEEYLKNLNNVVLLRQDEAVYNIGIVEFINNLFKTIFFLKGLLKAVKDSDELTELFGKNKGFLLDQFFICLCHYNYSRKIIEKNSFKVIFSTNDGNYLARSYFINANRCGIENIMTQHGFSSFIQTKTIANKVILWSQSDVKYYMQNKFSKERILTLGLPRFDKIREEHITKENNFEKLFNISNKVKRVCFAFPLHALNFNFGYYKAYLEEINNVSSFLIGKGIKIFIRAHPNDDIKSYQKFLSKELISKIIIPPTSFPLIQLIKQMDIFIADFSTSLMESMICNIPTIFFNYDNYWDNNDVTLNYKAVGGSYMVTHKNELLPVIDRILMDIKFRSDLLHRQNKFVEENIFNLGCATQKISDYVLHILENN